MPLIKAPDRGRTQTDWLDSRHTFSFGDYQNPARRGFGCLKVINDDQIAPGAGFPTHPHANMEIITYMLAGEIAHQDSLGHGSVIRRHELQRMSAGTGISHSEFNPSDEIPTHLLQIWIHPAERNLSPSYEQKCFDVLSDGSWQLLASSAESSGTLRIHQDVKVYRSLLQAGQSQTYSLERGRCLWVHMALGEGALDGQALAAGDGLGLESPGTLTFSTPGQAEILLFDLPGL